jgi:SRSO17 transposase
MRAHVAKSYMQTRQNTTEIERWGLSLEAIMGLKSRLSEYYDRYRPDLVTQTKDTSDYGYHYLSSLMRMETKRTMANIARTSGVPIQNMQQFISDSPWSGPRVIESVCYEVSLRPEFSAGSVLIIDESADAKSGSTSAGAGRQYNGRLGKVDMCQVGVFLSVANNGHQTWINGELYLPEAWFTQQNAAKRKRIGIPKERVFATKLELALKMVEQVQCTGVPFDAVDCDSLYGRKGWFRDQLGQLKTEYYADIPENTRVYLEKPLVYSPLTKRGKPAKQPEISGIFALAKELVDHSRTEWQTFVLRPCERGMLEADFARRRVWTVDPDGIMRKEWLLMRKNGTEISYSLSNAAEDTSLLTMAQRKSQRYFIERSNQDAKSELGWDEFQAIKYRAWEHHLAFTILASWFVTETQLDWARDHPRDPFLLEQYEIDALPNLSLANVRTLLRAVMPLPQLSAAQAAALVVEHLDNRTRSRKSRLHKLSGP